MINLTNYQFFNLQFAYFNFKWESCIPCIPLAPSSQCQGHGDFVNVSTFSNPFNCFLTYDILGQGEVGAIVGTLCNGIHQNQDLNIFCDIKVIFNITLSLGPSIILKHFFTPKRWLSTKESKLKAKRNNFLIKKSEFFMKGHLLYIIHNSDKFFEKKIKTQVAYQLFIANLRGERSFKLCYYQCICLLSCVDFNLSSLP